MGNNKHPIMFVLLTPKRIEYIPVAVERRKRINPKGPETRKTRTTSKRRVKSVKKK